MHGPLNVKFRIELSIVADSHICNDRYLHEIQNIYMKIICNQPVF
jgi:hypothetical protein